MLDITFIRANRELVREKSLQKLVDVDIDQLLGFDEERLELLRSVENLRAERNGLADRMKVERNDESIERGRVVKQKLTDLEHKLASVEQSFMSLLSIVPNMPTDDTPVGVSETDNLIISTVGNKPEFDFEPLSHDELLTRRDMLDKERAVKISGSRFAYLKGNLVRLQFALLQYVFDTLGDEEVISRVIAERKLGNLSTKPFTPVLPPLMMKTESYAATGRLKAGDVTYKLADDDLWLIGSAEHSLCSMYQEETLEEAALPIRYIGYSTSFRREAGTYGKDTAGILRMHHFDKAEMEVFSDADSSRNEHELLVGLQEYMLTQLGLHYQVILKCTADIGDPNARGVDINTWFPAQNEYRETHSADYMTDYQSRGLKTKYKNESGTNFVHTNDATAIAFGRLTAAIAEQMQTKELFIKVPEVLQKYLGGKTQL